MKPGFYLFLFSLIFFSSVLISSQPLPPQNLTAVEGTSLYHPVFVKLVWEGSGTTMTRFNIYKKDGPISDPGTYELRYSRWRGLKFTDYNVLPGATYSYYVTAVNLQGESDPSNYVEITLSVPSGNGTVTGTITDDNTTLPVPNSHAVFMKTTGFGMAIAARADSLGAFSASVPEGSYYMKTSARGYYCEFYDNVTTIADATAIVVTEGTTQNFNVGLAPYVPPVIYTLTGSVKDSLDNPLMAYVRAYNVRMNTFHRMFMATKTDTLGNFSLNVREGDTLVVYAQPANRNYYPEFWDNKFTYEEADRVPVIGNITGIDYVLQHRPVYQNGISGLVADAQNTPVESFVTAFRLESSAPMRKYSVSTDILGAYNFANLIPGKYILRVNPKDGYQPTYFKYDGTQTLDWRQADSVMVDETAVVPGINFTVLPLPQFGEGIIAGVVSSNTGEKLNSAFVYVLNENGEVAGYGISNTVGQYVIGGINAGEYNVVSDRLEYDFNSSIPVSIDYTNNLYRNVNPVLSPSSVTDVKDNKPAVVANYELFQNYPNPFNPATTIKFSLPEKSNVKLTVYNLLGVEVAGLLNETKNAGTHSVSFDASNLASGIYFYKLETGKFTQTRKLTLIK
jgi:hypothetical protein